MKAIGWSALACAVAVLVGCPQNQPAERREVVASAGIAPAVTSTSPASDANPGITLALNYTPVNAEINKGERYDVTLAGTWQATGTGAFYLQATDSGGRFVAPAPQLASYVSRPRGMFRITLSLPTTVAPGAYTGKFTVRACADSQCLHPYADAARSISYRLTVNELGEWETLQRTSRHDGYVPASINPGTYAKAWTYEAPSGSMLSGVVTDGGNIYFSESGSHSVYALRATDGVAQWRRVFTGNSGPRVAAPTASKGVVYVSTTGHGDTWLYALNASNGMQSYQSQFYTQWAEIFNPTVRKGRVYVNAGYYGGVVYAFNATGGRPAWNASGGTYGKNTPAADDDFAYAYNGSTLNVFNAGNGTLFASIGPSAQGVQTDYHGTVMLGSPDHAMAYNGASYGATAKRQLLNYSVAGKKMRWMSIALYTNYPAVAKGVVYATSNETYTLDALDEATGRLLWSWKPPEQSINFIGNVVAADNVVFVSTSTQVYAIDLATRTVAWSAPTPGTVSIAPDRMLFVSSPGSSYYPVTPARITAYRLN